MRLDSCSKGLTYRHRSFSFQRAQARCGTHLTTGTKATEVKILRINASTSLFVSIKQDSITHTNNFANYVVKVRWCIYIYIYLIYIHTSSYFHDVIGGSWRRVTQSNRRKFPSPAWVFQLAELPVNSVPSQDTGPSIKRQIFTVKLCSKLPDCRVSHESTVLLNPLKP